MLLVTAAAAACQRQLEWHPQRTCVSAQVTMCRGSEAAAMCLESTSPSCPVCVSACAPTANRHADLPNRHADLPSRRSSSTNRRSLRRHCVEARSISSGMRLQPRRSCAVNTSDFKTRVVYPRTECACVPLSVAHTHTMLRSVCHTIGRAPVQASKECRARVLRRQLNGTQQQPHT